MRKKKLSAKQVMILQFIAHEIIEHGYAPSVREIGKAVGLSSPSTVQSHLKVLERKGYLSRDASKSRALLVNHFPPPKEDVEGSYDPELLLARLKEIEESQAPVRATRSIQTEDIQLPTSNQTRVSIENLRAETLNHTQTLPLYGQVAAGAPLLAVEDHDEFLTLPIEIVGERESFVLKVRGDSMIEAGIFHGDYIAIARQSYAENGDIVVALIDDEATVKTFYREADGVRLQPENNSMEPIYCKDPVIVGKVTAVFRKL